MAKRKSVTRIRICIRQTGDAWWPANLGVFVKLVVPIPPRLQSYFAFKKSLAIWSGSGALVSEVYIDLLRDVFLVLP